MEAGAPSVRMVAIDLDGTLLGLDGRVSRRNIAALQAAEEAGIAVVIATGRRHRYALHVLQELGLRNDTLIVSSNGAVVRTFASELVERTLMDAASATWLCGYLGEFRNALVITFDKVRPDGDEDRGALVIEELEGLHASIGRWMGQNAPYIAQVRPIEDSLKHEAPIQMMLCGTVERMRRAEALMLERGEMTAVGGQRQGATISLARTEYPDRDLSLIDILPAGCSKGTALLRLAASRGIAASEIMAIGDNWNDLSMLEIAGHPVLMDNAPQDLKHMAAERGWRTTSAHDLDGVADALLSFVPEMLTAGVDAGSK